MNQSFTDQVYNQVTQGWTDADWEGEDPDELRLSIADFIEHHHPNEEDAFFVAEEYVASHW